jgi:glycosyltransferase involved in cell wall biosynthesis
VLEAMALGTPIVATSVGGTTELVTDGREGLVVPPENVDALVVAIERVCSDAAAAGVRVAAARRRVETDLSFEGRLRALEGIYRELAAARRPS